METFDVVIAGGGPAGAALGYLLQKAGIRTCIVDKAVFPREKLCGGMLTEKTVRCLESIYGTRDFPCLASADRLEIYLGTKRVSHCTTANPFRFVERRDFDFALLERFRGAGGTVREGVRVSAFRHDERRLTLSDGTELEYRVLAGADGASSQVRKLLDPDWKPGGFCVEGRSAAAEPGGPVRIYFGTSEGGYGWRFSKGTFDVVGLGADRSRDKLTRDSLTAFGEAVGAPVDPATVRGALIPYGQYVKCPCKDGVLLLGDAAGLIDPVTGEGVYFALRSAQMAVGAIRAFLRDGASLPRSYNAEIREIHKIMDSANRFRRILYIDRIQPLLMRHGARPGQPPRKHAMTTWFCDNVLAEYRVSYDRVLPHFVGTRLSGLLSPLSGKRE